jgi:enoyl-CoA hydratase/carnithine racemase
MSEVAADTSAEGRPDQGQVRYDQDGPVVRLTFDRPAARNAMTWKMYQELEAACDRIRDDNSVRVVVLRGAGGRAFIAGTDIAQFADFEDGDDGVAYEARMEVITEKLERLRQPTVAVIDGYAVGGGLSIAAVCDLRICTPAAKFGIPIARTLGNCLSGGTYARLVWMLGPAATKKVIFGAGFMGAEEAKLTGLATEVVEEHEIDDRVAGLAQQLSNQAPLTMWATKESIRRLMLANVPDTTDIVREVYGSSDFAEGNAAFVHKRQPRWQGV